MDKRLYYIWGDMMNRCRNPKHKCYKNYGARGIAVCERWQTSANFIADMSPRPDGKTLDRTDNSKGYSPDNCRWATKTEQSSNRRNCIYVMDAGERLTLKEYCRRHQRSYGAMRARLRLGWPMEKATETPIGKGRYPFGRKIS